jgi:predicted CXXCH cytochrome family protein
MPHRSRYLALFVCVLTFGQQPEGPGFLAPTDASVVKPGAVAVVARIEGEATLTLDGKPVEAKILGRNGLHATLKLAPGLRELVLQGAFGERKAKVFVSADAKDAPDGFAPFRFHPPGAQQCATCHVTEGGAWELKGGATPVQQCLGCHSAEAFPKSHTHTPDVLEECQMCHSPHGSSKAFHLKLERDVVCKICHG